MTDLKNQELSSSEIESALAKLSGWHQVENRIAKEFRFANFPDAMAFMVRAAFDAERLCHHPNWSNVYDSVRVELWSHELGGVSQRCLELAHCMEKQFTR